MAIITRAYSEVSGTIAYASSVNRVIDDLYTLQAGGINSANIAPSGIGAGNLESSSVVERALNNGAVSISKTSDEIQHLIYFANEVFG